jgi:hypothetical protein
MQNPSDNAQAHCRCARAELYDAVLSLRDNPRAHAQNQHRRRISLRQLNSKQRTVRVVLALLQQTAVVTLQRVVALSVTKGLASSRETVAPESIIGRRQPPTQVQRGGEVPVRLRA